MTIPRRGTILAENGVLKKRATKPLPAKANFEYEYTYIDLPPKPRFKYSNLAHLTFEEYVEYLREKGRRARKGKSRLFLSR
jgi:hypothetical protein